LLILRRMWSMSWFVVAMTLVGCVGEEVEPVTDPFGLAGCFTVDEACPTRAPHPSAACREGLECLYPAGRGDGDWSFLCDQGQWQFRASETTWTEPPPTAELCLDPLERSGWDGGIEVGPVDVDSAFRPYEAGEATDLVTGPTGVPTLAFRLRVSREIAPPECVVLSRDVRATGSHPTEPGATRVKLHCGESLAIFVPIPVLPVPRCDGERPVTLWASVQALGRTEVDLMIPPAVAFAAIDPLEGEGCPSTAPVAR
jgi:hypothetical protein